MKKPLFFFLLGTVSSFVFHHWIMRANENKWIDLFHSVAFGIGWALAYYVDRPDWRLGKKMGISFVGVGVLLCVGVLCFNLEIAVPSVIRYSTIFVAYYLFASFKENQSLRK